MPAEKELARQVVVVIGAGTGIGKETAHRLVKEGAHIVCVDMKPEAAEATAKEITDKLRAWASASRAAGISGCGPARRPRVQHHRPRQHPRDARPGRARLRRLRSHRVTAGVFWPSDTTGHIPDDKWAFTFGVNVTGSYIVGDEAAKTWKEQGLRGTLVLTTSANAVVAKKGSVAYDTRKPPRTTSCANSPSSSPRSCA